MVLVGVFSWAMWEVIMDKKLTGRLVQITARMLDKLWENDHLDTYVSRWLQTVPKRILGSLGKDSRSFVRAVCEYKDCSHEPLVGIEESVTDALDLRI